MRNPWMCLAIISVLGLTCITGLGGIILLSFHDKLPPESLVSVVSMCAGALSSFLVSPPKGCIGIYPQLDEKSKIITVEKGDGR